MSFYRLIYKTPAKKKFALTVETADKLLRLVKYYEKLDYEFIVVRFSSTSGKKMEKTIITT